MTQNPYPHDPLGGHDQGAETPGAGRQDEGPSGSPADQVPPAPSGSSANDPYAQPGAWHAAQTGQPGQTGQTQDPYAQGGGIPQGGYAQPGSYAQPGGTQHSGDAQRGGQGYQQGYGASAGDARWADAPPAGIKGVSDAPMTGQAVSDSDNKLWSLLAHLSALAGYVIGAGFLGWLGPLIIFLVYKDRSRYVRYNAAEALNAAIAVLIVDFALAIVFTVITVVTLGIGSFLFMLMFVPGLVHVIFAIIGAVKVNERQWWNYPVNIRLVK